MDQISGCRSVTNTFDFDLTGLEPWGTGDSLRVVSPNSGSFALIDTSPTLGSSNLAVSEPLTLGAIDATQGDETYVLQYKAFSDTLNGQVLGPTMVLTDLTVVSGGRTNVRGQLSRNNLTSLDLELEQSHWAAVLRLAGPSTPTQVSIHHELNVQPFVLDRQANGSILLAYSDFQSPFSAALVEETLRYNDPFPSEWPRILKIFEVASVAIPLSNSANTVSFPLSVGYEVLLSDLAKTPLIASVQQPKINGLDFFSSDVIKGIPVQLSWSPPTGLKAFAYRIAIFEVKNSDGSPPYLEGPSAWLLTQETSVLVPASLLSSDKTYIFDIQARADSKANIEQSPYRSGYPRAYSDTVSASFTIKR